MSNATRRIAEFGNDKGNARNVRVVVEIGDGAKLSNKPRTINYTVDGTAIRGDDADNPEDYFIDGCTSSNCSVRLPANTHSAVITINVNDDGLDEDDETIVLTLKDDLKDNSNKNGYTLNAQKTTTLTIRDDDTRGLMFHRTWPDVKEGDSQTYTVKLASQPTAAVTVKIASDNPDVTVDKSSLTFTTSNWKTTQTVRVSAAQDNDAVDDTATLTHTTSGGDYGGANALSIGRSVSVDDDDPRTTTGPQLPRISLTGGAAVTEGSAASFTVNADPAPTSSLTINVEVIEPPGQDFVAASEEGDRTVTLNAGATSTTFTVPTVNDGTSEEDGRVQVFVNDGTGYTAGQGSAVNVNDNDGSPPPTTPAASFASASSSAAENAGTRNVRVNLSPAAPSGGLTLSYSVSGTATAGSGNDFTIAGSGTLSVGAGATTADIPVAINDDSSTESAETVILTLTSDTGYTLGSTTVHTLTITDNDAPTPTTPAASFASAASSAAESAGTRNVRVNLSSSAPLGGLTLAYSVSGTATAGSGNDFTIAGSGTLTVGAGATTATIPVAINDDSSTESAETVILTLTGGTGYTLGNPRGHTLTITDNDDPTPTTPAASFASAASSAAENAGTRNVTVNLSSAAPSGGLTLGYNVSGTATAGSGNDFTIAGSGSLTVAAGDTSATIPVAINDDSSTESAETIILTLTGGTGYTLGSTRVHTLTITDNDGTGQPAVSFASGSSSAAESAGTRNVTVNLSPAAPSGGLTLGYSVSGTATAGSGNDFTIQNSGTLSVGAGATTATIPVAINDDSANEDAETVILTLTGGTGYTLGNPRGHTLTITDNDGRGTTPPPPPPTTPDPGETPTTPTGPEITVQGGSAVTEGGDAVFTISANPAPASALKVTVTVADDASSDFLAQADEGEKTVTIAGGETSATLTLTTQDDSADEADGSVTATLQADTGYILASSSTATVAVSDNDDETPAPVVTPGAQADPAAWLARFGRMVAGQALDGITGRMAAARRAGFTGNIGGRALGFGPVPTAGASGTGAAPESADVFKGSGPVNAARLPLSDLDRMFGTRRAAGASRSLTGRDLMLGSRFTLTGERDATGGSLAFWGQAAQSGFDGREGRVSLDGEATTAMLGADYARDRWLAGMALMQSGGKGDSRATAAGAGSGSGGDVETTLTAALPYASLQVSERMKLWGALGHGTGEVTLKPEPGKALTSDLSWTMAATGLRSEVIPPPEEGSGPALALVSDALWAGTSSDKAHELAASDSDVTRLRLGLEGSWTMALQDGGLVTPKLEAGLRHDDGDAETGFGVELGGGLAWEDPRLGLSLDLSGRMLVTHGADDLEDRGFAASLAFDPDPSTERGLSLALRQERGGQATGGLDALFRADPLNERTGSESDTRWSAEAAWGFPALGRRFTGSPHVGLGLATGARDYTLGWRLTPEAGAPDLGFGVTATRRESDRAAPQHGIGIQLNTRW